MDRQRTERPGAVLVTGAGGGLGAGIAQRLGAQGWAVALLGRRGKPLEDTRAGLSPRCPDALCLPVDVRSEQGVREALGRIGTRWGSLQVVVNCAALRGRGPQQVSRWDLFSCILRTNILGPALVTEHAVEWMGPGGIIVNVLDGGARGPTPDELAYGASKAGLAQLTRSLAARYCDRGIEVVGIELPTPVRDAGADRAVDAVVSLVLGQSARCAGRVLSPPGSSGAIGPEPE